MNVTVEVQVDMEVMTKYLARICKCIEVNALNTSKTKNTVQVGKIVKKKCKAQPAKKNTHLATTAAFVEPSV